MRAVVRPLAYHSAFSPIETIVFVCVLATLAYFHILAAIKHSSFFAPTFPSTLRPAHARLAGGEWVGVSERDWHQAFKHPEHGDQTIELQQVVFSLDDKTRKVSILTLSGRSEICMPACRSSPVRMRFSRSAFSLACLFTTSQYHRAGLESDARRASTDCQNPRTPDSASCSAQAFGARRYRLGARAMQFALDRFLVSNI